ncbi:bifunctional folylpolyglutamate synthase/dihydrofolate synthase [Aeoliella mucimassa]|uniref:Dihydrofolate synthase/folylpolyglutamate synthase n=1 Tax=Aeoliella mucimassa TaxID=2527972 RepID=A0A518AW69_9BACT|nr:folylpolyglutamate synthase/dihydrofolate synthase family protein [Aeoliella mucimassa]QDU58985.1 Folylpolyglutamate synthase [Aeoliella mucimassa]
MNEPASTPEPTTRRDLAVEWLLGRINYERVRHVPYGERQLKLDRMRQFVTALGSPDTAAPIVHIAGTKGKGSTAAMIAAMLTAAGYRVGVFSSPHLERLEERFAINGVPIPGETLADLVDQLRPMVDEFDRRAASTDDDEGLTFFDITTALALVYFAQQQCDAMVLEVGLGGRLDSTNVCLPAVSVITSISLDHTRQLGNTLASIAGEKAGIIKSGVPVVSGVVLDEPREVIAEVAREHGCRLIQCGEQFHYQYHGQCFDYLVDGAPLLTDVELSLAGVHQTANAAVALATIDELVKQGWHVPEQPRRAALANLQLAGRIELIAAKPLVVIDTAHNEASARALAGTLLDRREQPRTLIVACSRDKDVAAIARELLPAFERVLVTEYLSNPRTVPHEELRQVFGELATEQHTLELLETPTQAWQRALEVTPPEGLVAIAGSFFLAAELRPLVREQLLAGERSTIE